MTMRTEAIQGNDRRHSVLGPMVKGAALGMTAGYIGKYAIPLTKEEKSSDEYIKVGNKINNEKTAYNFRTENMLNSIKEKVNKTPAEDEFVKMFDGMKDGDKVSKKSIRDAIKNLSSDAAQVSKFKQLCKETSAIAEQTANQCMRAYNIVTKDIRPLGFFLTAGAVVGAFVALIGDILRTDVKRG